MAVTEASSAAPSNGTSSQAASTGANTGAAASTSSAESAGLGQPRYTPAERALFEKISGRGDNGSTAVIDDDAPADQSIADTDTDTETDSLAETDAADGETTEEQPQAAAADPVEAMLAQAQTIQAVALLAQKGFDKAEIASLLQNPAMLHKLASTLGNGAEPAQVQAQGKMPTLDEVIAEPLKQLEEAFDADTAGKFAAPMKAVAEYTMKQAQASIAPLKSRLEFLVGHVEDMAIESAAASLAGEFKALGTPDGVAKVRKAMEQMKPGQHKSIKEWMRAAAGGAFGAATKQDIQKEMAAKDQARRNGQPTSPSRAVQASSDKPMSREDFEWKLINIHDPAKKAAFKEKYGHLVARK